MSIELRVLELGQDDPRKCTARRLARMELARSYPAPARLLGEGEPRIIYVVSRKGERDLVLQGCQMVSRSISCHLKYRR